MSRTEAARLPETAPPPAEEVGCSHCGLPVPLSFRNVEREKNYCCEGCRTVREILLSSGFDRYYALRAAGGVAARPARTRGGSYEEMDDAAYQAGARRIRPDGLSEIDWILEGVHCAACVWLVERLPRLDPGLVEIRLDLPRSRARVVWDPARAPLSRLARLIDGFGYPPHPFRAGRAEAARRADDRRLLLRLGVAGACAANVMAIAFALWGGILDGMEAQYDLLFRWTSLAVTILALLYGGDVFLRGAFRALRARTLNMDAPIALGLTAGLVHGAINTVRATGPVYFDAVATLVVLLLAGRFVQQRQQRRAADSAELLASLAPSTARLVGDDGGIRIVPAASLLEGARVEVRSGESFPADGVILEGRTAMDLALLTGEPRPVAAGPGDEVHAGTVNLAARVLARVTAAGESTRVGRLARLVEEYAARRAPLVLLADRISGYFVAAVLVLALGTAALWIVVDRSRAFDATISLLIVSCPCALGLATPLAFGAAIGRAARTGILVKGGDVIERLARPGRIWLDKTGTLTDGRLSVVAWGGDPSFRPLAAALERESSHPVARALAAEAAPSGPRAEAVEETPGGGIAGRVAGRALAVGSPAFAASRAGVLPADLAALVAGWARDGLTPIVVLADDVTVAAGALGDHLRPEAAATLARLRAQGWRPGILSGDDPRATAAVARSLDFDPADVRGGVSPEGKIAVVTSDPDGPGVVMVGDGVNDAAALAAAGVGIAVHGGAEAAMEAADVYIGRPGIGPLAELLDGARRTMVVVKRNLGLSIAYNGIGVALAMAGLIDPIVAAVLMPLSSMTVVAHSYRARTFTSSEGRSCR